MTDDRSFQPAPRSPLRRALHRIATASVLTLVGLFLASETRPGGAAVLYGSLLAVYSAHQLWLVRRPLR